MNRAISSDACPVSLITYWRGDGKCDWCETPPSRQPIRIQLVGEVYSGKTTYLAVALNRTRSVLPTYGVNLVPWGRESSERLNYYSEYLGRCLRFPCTLPGSPPIGFHVVRERKSLGDVLFYDEESPHHIQDWRAALADGFLVVLDPVTILPQEILCDLHLADSDSYSEEMSIGREGILNSIRRIIWARQPHGRQDKKHHAPVAVVVTKSDLVHDGFPQFFINAGAAQTEDTEGFLGRYFPDLLSLLCGSVRNYRCFLVSATGCSVGEDLHHYRKIDPHNVERPLLWLLQLLVGVRATGYA